MIAPPSFDPWVAALGSKQGADRVSGSVKQAAQQFEALLIRQFLSNARSTSWLNEQQESESGWREIADDSLAGYLVKAGGLGLSKQVESMINQAERGRKGLNDVSATNPAEPMQNTLALNRNINSTVKGKSLLEHPLIPGAPRE